MMLVYAFEDTILSVSMTLTMVSCSMICWCMLVKIVHVTPPSVHKLHAKVVYPVMQLAMQHLYCVAIVEPRLYLYDGFGSLYTLD